MPVTAEKDCWILAASSRSSSMVGFAASQKSFSNSSMVLFAGDDTGVEVFLLLGVF